MRLVTVPNNVSREELIEKVQTELSTMRPHSRALVLLDKQIINHSMDIPVGTHTIRCLSIIERTLPMYLRGERADVIAVKNVKPISRELAAHILVILNDHPEDTGVLICSKELEDMLK